MRDVLKSIGLLIVGLMIAVFFYPFIHEFSHSIIALLVGAEIFEFNILPVPNILCNVSKVDDVGIVAIGLSGMILPFLFSAVIKPKRFWLWYANFLIKGISVLAFLISGIATISFMSGKPIPNEDITQVLGIWQTGKYAILVVLVLLVCAALISIVKDKPIRRCIEYFIKPMKKTSSAV